MNLGDTIQSIAKDQLLIFPYLSVTGYRPMGTCDVLGSSEAISKMLKTKGCLPLALWAAYTTCPIRVIAFSWGEPPHIRLWCLPRGSLHSMTAWEGRKGPAILTQFRTIPQGSPSSRIPIVFPEPLLSLFHKLLLFSSILSLSLSYYRCWSLEYPQNTSMNKSLSQRLLPKEPSQCHQKSKHFFI